MVSKTSAYQNIPKEITDRTLYDLLIKKGLITAEEYEEQFEVTSRLYLYKGTVIHPTTFVPGASAKQTGIGETNDFI